MNAAVMQERELEWSDRYLLGFAPMDAHHQEFVETLNALATASPAELRGALDHFIAETETHFQDENDWMTKHAFPPRDCHMREHQAVLDTLYEARGLVAVGRTDFLPGMIAALADWFPARHDRRAGRLVSRTRRVPGFGTGAVDGEENARRRADRAQARHGGMTCGSCNAGWQSS